MLGGYLDWPGVAQVCRIESEVRTGAEETYEVSYAITSVARHQADAATLLSWHRGHWGIENRLHWVRDVTMGEDANRTRTGSGPQVLAAFRNAAIGQLRAWGSTNIAASLRRNAARVHDLLKVLYSLTN
jgi:predicted transposase YbfD/YdcC